MPASTESPPIPQTDIQVPLPVVSQFLRQLIHDLRNHLNAAELQSAFLAEIAESGESREEIKRLRATISQVGTDLQRINKSLGELRLTKMCYGTADFLADLQQTVRTAHPDESARVEWSILLGERDFQIDPQLLLPALTELFANAFQHNPGDGQISAKAEIQGDRFVFTLCEPKQIFERSTDKWGREPFQGVGKGHYGLGLHRARVIIEAHGGQLKARYDSPTSSLITTVFLPVAK